MGGGNADIDDKKYNQKHLCERCRKGVFLMQKVISISVDPYAL
jgi:hypothetical protein